MHAPKVYISYSRDDAAWVHKFAEALRQQQVHVWLDDWEIRPGDLIADAVEVGLRGSDIIVSVLTPGNARRPNVMFDLGVALGGNKRLIPIISPELEGSEIPSPFRARQPLPWANPTSRPRPWRRP